MPSYVAWTAAILYQLYRHALPSALTALFHWIGTSSPTFAPWSMSPLLISRVLAVLRVPFHHAASTVLVVGIAIQTVVLLEQETADRVGTWLNRPATPDLLDLLYIAKSPASTAGGDASYASTLSALLTVPLTLPVLSHSGGGDGGGDAPSSSSFSEEEIREWDDANAVLRAKLEQGMVDAAEQWLDVLEHVPLLGPDSRYDSDTLLERRIEYLEVVRIELDLVAARNPTPQVYYYDDHDSEEWRALELEEREREERRRLRMEDRLERWLDEIFLRAEAEADPDRAEGGGNGSGINNEAGAMQTKRGRDLLDVSLGPGPTWRDQLRAQWKTMYDPAAGGVLGNVEREMDNLAAKFGLEEEEEDAENDDNDEEAAESPRRSQDRRTPEPLPLMAAHHLRAQLASTIADLRSGASAGAGAGDGPLAALAHQEWERATLPPSLDASWPDEDLSLEQLAIRVDRRARQWALRILQAVITRRASWSPEARTIGPLSVRQRVNLLRPTGAAASSPFPSFMRTVDATFKAPRDPAHFRIGISQHDLANAIFALPGDPSRPAMAPRGVMARGQGEGGCSALQRARWRREAGEEGREEVERRLRAEQRRGQREGRDSRSAGGRDEL